MHFLLLALLALLAGCTQDTDDVAIPAQPNVIIVITDDQGYGDLGFHGNPVIQTPNLDQLAAASARLDDYHVAATCAPTRSALLTGRWQNRVGVWHTVMGRSMLRRGEVTLANMLVDAGYRTMMVGKWHLGDNYPYRPHDRGFEQAYYHGGGGVGQTPDVWDNAYFDGAYYRNGVVEPAVGYVTDVFFDEAIDFIDSVKGSDAPFFLYLSTNAPHGPMHAPQAYADLYADVEQVGVRHFLGMITNIDDNVGRLRAYLEAQGLAENTIFVFTTDNGTSSGMHIFNAGMRGKKGSEYDGGHRVPFFVHWPAGNLAGSRRVDHVTAHVDIVPTILELTASKLPAGIQFDGVSLVPLLRDPDVAWPDRILITDSQRVLDPIKWRRTTVMTDRWRQVNGVELYDIDADPGQESDVAAEYPGVMRRLTTAYEDWWSELLPTFGEPTAIVIGSAAANPVRLTGHDWLGTNAQVPWNQRHIRSLEMEDDGIHKGYWAIDVETAGRYVFELRRWPAEAALPITASAEPGAPVPGAAAFRMADGEPFPAVRATLSVGELELSAPVGQGDESVQFDVELGAGKMPLVAVFEDEDARELGAYYVTVNYLGQN
jgi:arylsulfatase B